MIRQGTPLSGITDVAREQVHVRQPARALARDEVRKRRGARHRLGVSGLVPQPVAGHRGVAIQRVEGGAQRGGIASRIGVALQVAGLRIHVENMAQESQPEPGIRRAQALDGAGGEQSGIGRGEVE